MQNASARKQIVLVAGDGTHAYAGKSELVGEWLAQAGFHLLTGGGGGVMEAVGRAFTGSIGRRGLAVGIIPGSVNIQTWTYRTKGNAYPNPYVDVAIRTHLNGADPEGLESRNHINVLSADLVIGLPGGAGTHAEIQLARRYRKPTLIFLSTGESILGKNAEALRAEGFQVVESFPELLQQATAILRPNRLRTEPVRIAAGSGVVLRSWRWDDIPDIVRHANNRKVARNLHDGFPSPYYPADARRWLAHILSMPEETVFAIEVDGVAAGAIGFHPREGMLQDAAEVGYWLGEPYWGRGITTAAVRAASQRAFDTHPELVRLYAHVFEWNTASARVLEKAGYTCEGVMKRAAVKDCEHVDVLLYALVR